MICARWTATKASTDPATRTLSTSAVELKHPEDGSVPRRVKAAAYLAHNANPSPPSRRYLDAVLKGARAHHLPDDYIATLTRLPVLAEEAAPEPGAEPKPGA
jgi:hypothetical protein